MDERLVAEQITRGGRLNEHLGHVGAESAAKRRSPAGSGRQRVELPVVFGPEEYILGWLLVRPELLPLLDEEMIGQQAPPLSADDLSSAENQAILSALLTATSVGEEASVEDRLSGLPEPLLTRARAAVAEVLLRPPLTDEKITKDLGDSLLRVRERNLKRQIQQLEFLIRESAEVDDREETRRLHELMMTYTAQKRHIQRLLNLRSIAGVMAQRKPVAES